MSKRKSLTPDNHIIMCHAHDKQQENMPTWAGFSEDTMNSNRTGGMHYEKD